MNIFVLSGAGLSKASGIPTFQEDSSWRQYRDQMAKVDLTALILERRTLMVQAEPNAGHIALARLQKEWGPDNVTLVTQNVDGLLQKAGALEVFEMHGSVHRIRCVRKAHHEYPWDDVQVRGICPSCGRKMRPDVVWFGEPVKSLNKIKKRVRRCDIFVSVGTSGIVYPAAELHKWARRAITVEINPEFNDQDVDFFLPRKAEEVLPDLVETLLTKPFTNVPVNPFVAELLHAGSDARWGREDF